MLRWFKKNTEYLGDFAFLEADIHSHILFGIDDGAKEIEESLKYIEDLQSLGFKKFIFTPHIFSDLYPNTNKTIEPVFLQLKEHLPATDIDFAAEYMMDHEFEALVTNDQLLTIGDRYVLVEMSYLAPFRNFKEVIFNLKVKGYKPILAHPERYVYWHNDFAKFEEAKDIGCSFQLNLLSAAGYYGSGIKGLALKLLSEQMYEFAGTDLHHEKHLNALKKLCSSKLLRQLSLYSFKNAELTSLKV